MPPRRESDLIESPLTFQVVFMEKQPDETTPLTLGPGWYTQDLKNKRKLIPASPFVLKLWGEILRLRMELEATKRRES